MRTKERLAYGVFVSAGAATIFLGTESLIHHDRASNAAALGNYAIAYEEKGQSENDLILGAAMWGLSIAAASYNVGRRDYEQDFLQGSD